jgi:hypothetical protein
MSAASVLWATTRARLLGDRPAAARVAVARALRTREEQIELAAPDRRPRVDRAEIFAEAVDTRVVQPVRGDRLRPMVDRQQLDGPAESIRRARGPCSCPQRHRIDRPRGRSSRLAHSISSNTLVAFTALARCAGDSGRAADVLVAHRLLDDRARSREDYGPPGSAAKLGQDGSGDRGAPVRVRRLGAEQHELSGALPADILAAEAVAIRADMPTREDVETEAVRAEAVMRFPEGGRI